MCPAGNALLEASEPETELQLASRWLDLFEQALRSGNEAGLAKLFVPDSHWRDLVAFTWFISPHRGCEDIAKSMIRHQQTTKAHSFSVDPNRTQPRKVRRADTEVVEAIFAFETEVGRGSGVVRLMASDPSRAWMIMTSLQELKGFEEPIGKRRPTGEAYSRNFGGTNWKDQRIESQAYKDRDPAVLIVGGGQAGLTLAARLGRLGVDTLVIDKNERIGDNWRKRYHSLALHNHTDVNHLPYIPFPPHWPSYLPKDMLADWFESYAWAMEINFWTGTELKAGRYNTATGTWTATVRSTDGRERTLHPRHLVFANGIIGFPRSPNLPGLDDFKGDLMHTSKFTSGANWRGKRALVIGTGTSGHDVAQDLYSNGVETTIVQRGSTTVVSINPSAKLIYGSYDDGTPIEDADLSSMTNTLPITQRNLQRLTARMVELDRKLIDGLIACGFKFDIGEDGGGHQMKARRRSGGYYLNAGCSELIIEGKIGLLQYDRIDRFVANGARLKDGTIRQADLIVLATGYFTQQVLVSDLLGQDIADRVGKVWGIGPDGELNNMWKRTAQDGLWFVGGSFTNCRIYSRYVALQIKGIEEGMTPKGRPDNAIRELPL